MKFLNKLERKFGRYAIPNLSLYIVIAYAIGYILQYTNPIVLYFLELNPALILQGQVWRLVTWVISPPGNTNIIFAVITLFFYYSVGTSLEMAWGTFRYNAYVFLGLIATAVGLILLYGVGMLFGQHWNFTSSTYYLAMSIFLAYAASFPEMQVLLYAIIPVKVKWLGILDGVFLLYSFIMSGLGGKVAIVISILNFLVFFFTTRNYKRISPKEQRRKQKFRKEMHTASGITRHKCAICGRTEMDAPSLDFRFCSKCDGNYEYCNEHLFTHTHVKKH